MHLNIVDFIIIGLLIFFALEAIRQPLIWELFDLFGFTLAGLLSFSYYNLPAKFLESEFKVAHGISLVLGFMAAWFLAEFVFFLLARIFVSRLPKIKLLWSKTLSVVPAISRGLVFIAIALIMVGTFPIQPAIKKTVLDSTLGSKILKQASALEAPVKQVFGGVANDSLTFLTIKPKTNEKINLGFQTSDFTTDHATETAMIELVNKERIKSGLNVLVLDENLRAIGRGHSADMFRRGYFSHYSPEGKSVADRLLEANIDFVIVGENLAYAPSLELAFKGLMNSQGHRANILSTDYGKIGIGVMDGGVYGKMFTQVFTN